MTQPNVIFFTWHDAGDWFGCYGHPTVDTPNCDRLAAEGVRFANNFSACAICSPSRAAMMTGLYCQRTGVMTLANDMFVNRIHPHIPHLAKRLKHAHGYRTALFGVQHEAAHEHTHEVMDFDEQFATNPWPNADLTKAYVSKWLRERAASGTPFYAQIGTHEAHLNRFYSNQPARTDEAYPPVQYTERGVADPPYLTSGEADRQTIATLQGLLQRGDRLMGAVLDALDETGLADNTIVCMCVDHGVGLTRAKTTCYDPGCRTAWVLRYPGKLPAGHVVNAMTAHVDVLPTLWELLGFEALADLDGVSLARHAKGESDRAVHDAVFCHMVENTRSIRTTTHKLIRNFRQPKFVGRQGDSREQHRGYDCPADEVTPTSRPHIECYDLGTDPWEMHNLADDPSSATIVRDLDDRLWRFLIDTDDFVIHDPVRTEWQQVTRRHYEDYCRRSDITPRTAEGPGANAIDAASACGRVDDDWMKD